MLGNWFGFINLIIEDFKDYCKKNEKFIFYICFAFFIILTTIGVIYHETWYDEAQAWLIAQDLSFFEMLKYMRYEGHMFLWYTMIMPFAKLGMTFPYPIQIINLLMIWGAVYVLWKKAPLNPLIKALITFSTPIAYQYAVVARSYAVGILLLFLLAALFKKKLQHPYIYAILIFFCANNNALTLFGATAFGLLFFWDYVTTKKDFYKSKEFYILCTIALFCVFMIGYQLIGADKQSEYLELTRIVTNKNRFLLWNICYALVNCETKNLFIPVVMTYLILATLTFKYEKKSLFFLGFTSLSLYLLHYNFYLGQKWHYYFFYIYFVIALWLYKENVKEKSPYYPLLITFFIVVSYIQIQNTISYYTNDIDQKYSATKELAQVINQNEEVKQGNIVIFFELAHGLIPYLRQYNIKAYDLYSKKEASFHNYNIRRYIFFSPKVINKYYFEFFENKPIYIILPNRKKGNLYKGKDYRLEYIGNCLSPGIGEGNGYCLAKLIPTHN